MPAVLGDIVPAQGGGGDEFGEEGEPEEGVDIP
jgi:hypothetical protein